MMKRAEVMFSRTSKLLDETTLLMRSTIAAYTSARQCLMENKLVIMVFVFPHKSVYSFNSGSSFSAHVAVWLAHISGTNINNVLMSFCQFFFFFTFLKRMNEQQEMAKWLKIHRTAFLHLSAGWFRSAQFVHGRGQAPCCLQEIQAL